MDEFGDKTGEQQHSKWVRLLTNALREGQVMDLSSNNTESAVDREHAIPSSAIRQVILAPPRDLDPHGLRIHGALVQGVLDLQHAVVPFVVTFERCEITSGILAEGLRVKRLNVIDCIVSQLLLDTAHIDERLDLSDSTFNNPDGIAINLDGAVIDGDLFAMNDFAALGEISAMGVRIAGQMQLSGATVHNTGRALALDGATIAGDFFARSCRIEGDVRAPGMAVGGQLSLSGTHIVTPGGTALNLDGSTIAGDFSLRLDFRIKGEMSAVGASIGGQMRFARAELANPRGTALSIDNCVIRGGLIFGDRFISRGLVSALDSSLGWLELDGQFLNPGKKALAFDRSSVAGGVTAHVGFRARGDVRAPGARIGGQLRLERIIIHSPERVALSLDGAVITGGISIQNGSRINGETRLVDAQFAWLSLDGSTLWNPNGNALAIDGSMISGGCSGKSLRVVGRFRAVGAVLGGPLNLDDANLSCTKDHSARMIRDHESIALLLDRGTFPGGISATGSFTVNGRIQAIGASFGGLNLNGASISNPNLVAVDLERSSITALTLTPSTFEGQISCSGTTIGTITTSEKPPQLAAAHNWHIGAVQGPLRDDPKLTVTWLSRSRESTAQSWEEWARLYDREGQPGYARVVRLHADRMTTRRTRGLTRIGRVLYELSVGYGHYPLVAAAWLILGIVATGVLCMSNQSAFVPTLTPSRATAVSSCPDAAELITAADSSECLVPAYPAWSPWGYAIVTVTPASTLVQPAWAPNAPGAQWLLILLTMIKAGGWIMTALFLAGVTGLLRRNGS